MISVSLSNIECYDRGEDRWTDVASMNRERWYVGTTVHNGIYNVELGVVTCTLMFVLNINKITCFKYKINL